MFDGYLALGSAELINAARTEAYVAHQAPGMSFKRRARETDLLHLALGDGKYESPVLDDAPWFDPRFPETSQFYGLYPLELQGFEDSTTTASAVELLGDGAIVSSQRESGRSLRVHGILVGSTEAGVQAGLSWLNNTVKDPGCSLQDSCGAGDFTFFRSAPQVAEMVWLDTELPSRVERFGPLVSGKTLVHKFSSYEAPASMPMRVAWSGLWAEGGRYVFGALGPNGAVLESTGPVLPFRRNYFPNPSFRSTVEGIVPASGSLVARDPNGGVNGASGARVTGYGGTTADVPYGDGAYGDGAYGGGGTATPTTLPSGYGFGEGGFGDGGFGGVGPDADTTDAAAWSTRVVSMPAGVVTVSLALRSDAGATVLLSLIDVASGVTLAQADHVADASYTRVAVTGTISSAGVKLTAEGSAGFDFDQILFERSSTANAYFDGDSAVSGYDAAWEGDVSQSSSTLMRHAHTLGTSLDAGFTPFLQSLEGDVGQVRMTWWGREGIAPEDQVLPLTRILHGVKCIQGPKVIVSYSDFGGWYIEVDMLFVAEIPAPFTPMVPMPTTVAATKHFLDTGEPAALDALWLYDPVGPTPTPAPKAPILLPVNTTTTLDWRRAFIELAAPAVAENAFTVPQLSITTGNAAINNMRLRFHPNPFGFAPEQVDPLSYCGEFLISYLPARTRLLLDGITERATASRPGKASVSAAHLISSDIGGAPMVWPALSCGMAYVLTVDVPTTGSHDYTLDLLIATKG